MEQNCGERKNANKTNLDRANNRPGIKGRKQV